LLVLGACGPPSGSSHDPTGTTAAAIAGGSVDTTDGFAVGVCGTDTVPGTCQLICSGVLIAPNLVATARHCVEQVSGTTIDCSVSTFGAPLGPASAFWITTNYVMLQPSAGWHQVAKVVTPSATTSRCSS
jgi:trypsin